MKNTSQHPLTEAACHADHHHRYPEDNKENAWQGMHSLPPARDWPREDLRQVEAPCSLQHQITAQAPYPPFGHVLPYSGRRGKLGGIRECFSSTAHRAGRGGARTGGALCLFGRENRGGQNNVCARALGKTNILMCTWGKRPCWPGLMMIGLA